MEQVNFAYNLQVWRTTSERAAEIKEKETRYFDF